jgi:hypothetical protein
MLVAGLLLAGGYAAVTLTIHLRHSAAGAETTTVLANLLRLPATYVAPPQTLLALPRIVSGAPQGEDVVRASQWITAVAGAAVLAGVAATSRAATRPLRLLVVLALAVAAPVLAVPMPADWFEARYLYPVTAFLAAPIVHALASLLRALRGRRLRAAVYAALAAWGLGVLAGSMYMQLHAREMGASPASDLRLRRLEEAISRETAPDMPAP